MMPDRWIAVGIACVAVAGYVLAGWGAPTVYDYYGRLADAFVHGRYWLVDDPPWLNELLACGDGRWCVAYPWRHLVVSRVYNRVIRLLFAGGWRDVDCAFKLFRAGVFERVPLDGVRSNGAFFSPELLITLDRAGIRIRQVGVRHFPRTSGEPKGASPRVIVRAIRDLLRLRLRLWFGGRT